MSFDPRSLERLRQLGRSLPQPLPPPEPPLRQGPAGPQRHRVETEEDPEQLFRELMQASADGTVPPHLLDRLKQLEERRQPAIPAAAASEPAAPRRSTRRGASPAGGRGQRPPSEALDLYTAFQQLLLEDDEA
jgi:hypothetical protein